MPSRPNILFLFTDQQARQAISASGNPHVHTPHMDSIATQGVRFELSYCTSPVCGPSRSSLLTGLMPHETGVNVNMQKQKPGIPTMGGIFGDAGYATAWAGAWGRLDDGISGFEDLTRDRRSPKWSGWVGEQLDGAIADQAIEFLRRPHERPFLLGVSLVNPHDICWWVRRKPVEHPNVDAFPPLPANFGVDPEEPGLVQWCRGRPTYGEENQYTRDWDANQWRAYLHEYYRLIQLADGEVGRILQVLRECGLEENTLIVFTSDHGEGMAAHRWISKLILWENPVSVPLIVSWKGVTPPGVVNRTHLASGTDVLPTLCDYAQVTAPQCTGISLRPCIEDPATAGREYLVCELGADRDDLSKKGRMVRTARYKYMAFSEGSNPELLFDMETDPGETRNLAHDPGIRQELTNHRRRLDEWIARTDDAFEVQV